MLASTVTEYLATLSAERRDALNEVRRGINRALPPGYEEGIQFGMISWFVPLATYPAGYGGNPKQPLPLISLASQKSYMALHMICFYGQPALLEWFKAQYGKSGKKLDMGKGCLRQIHTIPRMVNLLRLQHHWYEWCRQDEGCRINPESLPTSNLPQPL
jgi:hypothetical protein